jgi:hypothetical protein
MKSAKNLEQSIKQLTVESSGRIHDRILEKLLRKLDQSKRQTTVEQANIWQTIVKSKASKIAAACVIIAVLIALHPFSSSLDGTTSAYAKVGEATKKVPWMRITYTSRLLDPNGNVRPDHQGSTDIWYSFNSQILIQRYSSGHITFIDYDKQEVYNYNPDSKRIVLSALPGDKLPLGANSPWSWLERNIQRMMPFGGDVTRRTGQYDGQEVEVFEIVSTPKPGVAAVHGKIFVDKVTSLPIAEERIYIDTNIDKPQCEEKGTFEYPQRGPSDIYDLGLSRDIPIVDSRSLPPWEVIDLLYESCRRTAPERYIAIVTRELRILGAPIESVEICYADAARSREEQHFLFRPGYVGPQWAEQAAEIGNTFDSILKWSQAFKARGEISISIFDKSSGSYAHRQDNGTWKTTKQTFEGRELTADDFWSLCPIVRIGWPEIRGYADVIQDDYARENNLIHIEAKGCQFYLNPDRDYICQMQINDHGEKTEVKEFAQTREGKWYPRRIEEPGIANTAYLETNPFFPEGIFNPNNIPKEIGEQK